MNGGWRRALYISPGVLARKRSRFTSPLQSRPDAHDEHRAVRPRSQTWSAAAMDEFLASHSDAEVMENGKIRCTLTGHEVAPQLATVQAYWMGKKYRNAKARREYDYSQHEPYLVPHTKSEHLLYCTLTKQPVSKQQRAVEGHLNGKKFKRLKALALAPQAAGSSRAGGADEDDEEQLEDLEDDELEEADEIQAFLSHNP